MRNLLVRFVREEAGQDLVEYAFLVAFIALIAYAGINILGTSLNTFYNDLGSNMPAVPNPS